MHQTSGLDILVPIDQVNITARSSTLWAALGDLVCSLIIIKDGQLPPVDKVIGLAHCTDTRSDSSWSGGTRPSMGVTRQRKLVWRKGTTSSGSMLTSTRGASSPSGASDERIR